ncbi:MAG: alpha/beta hydrolase, partial [Mycobacterium sp.]
MQLHHIDLGKLIAAAGGDPWAINKSLQSGRPAQISDLAQAFHNAGQCTTEASNAFLEARRRFEAAWNREDGEHPI